jgi:hypothetical protein
MTDATGLHFTVLNHARTSPMDKRLNKSILKDNYCKKFTLPLTAQRTNISKNFRLMFRVIFKAKFEIKKYFKIKSSTSLN